ncbi:MAG: RDD family protein [Coriobacteriia bacterium]|nr:RDD family protein [Coriobacteriia bacterium]
MEPAPIPTLTPMPQPFEQPTPVRTPAARPLRYAGFWRRFIAVLIDGVLFGLLWFVLSGLYEFATSRILETTAFSPDGVALGRALWLISAGRWMLAVLAVLLYFVLPEATKRGASPGKLAMRLRVAQANGGRTGIVRSALRTALKPISAAPLMLGFVIAGWNHRKQALHDLLSGSVVLRA